MKTILDQSAGLRAKMIRMKPREGLNPLHTFRIASTRVRLAALVRNSRIIDWVTLDATGKQRKALPRKVSEGRKTTCWRCFKDRDGNLHCVEIPCPKDTKPWPGF